jgi:hypothetical protein
VKSIGGPGDKQRCQDAGRDPDGNVTHCPFKHFLATNESQILVSNP